MLEVTSFGPGSQIDTSYSYSDGTAWTLLSCLRFSGVFTLCRMLV